MKPDLDTILSNMSEYFVFPRPFDSPSDVSLDGPLFAIIDFSPMMMPKDICH